jgi:predicted nucleotidyltransferase component of viral defense system
MNWWMLIFRQTNPAQWFNELTRRAIRQMIEREEIDSTARELGVHASNTQRDYVFGWLLAGIYAESELGGRLVLKGGNCLRKGYFPFGRFSNDLDFSTDSGVDEAWLASELNRVCQFVHEQTGLDFDLTRTIARPKRGADDALHAIEARVYFRDFYGKKRKIVIGIRMDITQFERLYLPVQSRRLIHNYSDYERCQAEIRCVKLEEQLASKLKCLLQRRHVADLFDFVYCTLIHPDFAVDRGEVLSTFLRKTIFNRSPGVAKGLFVELPLSIFGDLWSRFIVCPLRTRIDFDSATAEFQRLIAALFEAINVNNHPVEFFPAALRNPIMQAGQQLTVLNVVYDGVRRQVEPYSLMYKIRKDGVGREYFYVYDRTGGSRGPGLKAFVASSISTMENTEEVFEPRFPVELTKAGQLSGSIYFPSRRRGPSGALDRPTKGRVRRARRRSSDRYRIQCSICGKRFYRDTYATRLRPHKDKYGNRCIGRIGYMV